jgi:hypothetical protein
VEDEFPPLLDLDQFCEVLLRLLWIDVGSRVVAKDAEVPVDVEIHGGRLNRAVPQRLDDDAAGLELVADRLVRKDHVPQPTVGFRSRIAASAQESTRR